MRATRVIVAVTLVFGGSIAFAGPASSQAPTWSIRPSFSPPAPTAAEFDSVACASSTRCFAVGEYWMSPGVYATAIEQWDGAQWSIIPSPAGGEALYAIACPSSTTCLAVGAQKGNAPLVERWNGTTWSIDKSPIPGQFNSFNILACSGPTHCFATAQGSIAVAEWNGHAWSASAVPRVSLYDGFNDLTCASTTSCFAIGGTVTNGANESLIEHWNGTTWSIMTSPSPAGYFYLWAVTCATETSCFAVGSAQGSTEITNTFVEQWNGSAWSIIPSPNVVDTTSNNELDSVVCTSETDCVAGGSFGLFEHWDGTSWSIVGSPSSAGSSYGDSRGIACASPTKCFSVGYNGTATVAQWDGATWTGVAVPQPAPTKSTLNAVSCTTTSCFAVGAQDLPNGYSMPVIDTSTPAGWVLSPSPTTPNYATTFLSGVSCPSSTRCFAVGATSTYLVGGPRSATLIERWNGTTWTIMRSANRARISNALTGVTCTSTQQCFAVGNAAGFDGLIERWNGSSWSIVPIPSKPTTNDEFESVSCASAVSCFAVGSQGGYYGEFKNTLIEQWNGKKWSIVPSVDAPGSKFSRLWSVSCPSTKSCYAVGASYGSTASDATMKTLIEHWNGSAWKRVASVEPAGAKRNSLLSVSCTSASTCIAVGASSGSAGSNTTTLVESLSGTTWSIVTSPNPVGIDASLNGVACVTATSCSAVGGYRHGISHATLVEHSG